MIDTKELPVTVAEVEEVFNLGKGYANAMRTLDSRLATISDDDLAVGLDVGRGTDAAAFKHLGFKKAIVTNSPSGIYEVVFAKIANQERGVFQKVQERLPTEYVFSNLGITDFLRQPSFSPRLITMLKIGPQYFGKVKGDPAYDLMQLLEIHKKLKPSAVLIFSALDSDDNTEDAFRIAGQRLTSESVFNEVLIDKQIPQDARCLGERILTIRR